jgi:hypothetical protein
MISMLATLKHFGFEPLARKYLSGKVREKQLMAELACRSISDEASGNREGANNARRVAMLAAFLHEAKHASHAASPHAEKAFWAHLQRITRQRVKHA